MDSSTLEPTNTIAGSQMTESQELSAVDADVYRSVSRSAVAALILGIVGLLAFWFGILVILPVLGLVFALVGMRAVRRFPDEIQGRSLAVVGGALCLATTIAAPAYHTYVYMTEVPDGYERLSFSALKAISKSDDVPPAEALQFDGQKIFIKGYIHPTSMNNVLAKKFILVPDLGTCCFGGQPPLTHMIEVSLSGEQYARKSLRKQRLAGTLRINRQMKPVDGLTGVFYQLRADILK